VSRELAFGDTGVRFFKSLKTCALPLRIFFSLFFYFAQHFFQVIASSSPLMSGFIDFGSELDQVDILPFTQELELSSSCDPILADMASQVGIFWSFDVFPFIFLF
jgi:hypothetical protein